MIRGAFINESDNLRVCLPIEKIKGNLLKYLTNSFLFFHQRVRCGLGFSLWLASYDWPVLLYLDVVLSKP